MAVYGSDSAKIYSRVMKKIQSADEEKLRYMLEFLIRMNEEDAALLDNLMSEKTLKERREEFLSDMENHEFLFQDFVPYPEDEDLLGELVDAMYRHVEVAIEKKDFDTALFVFIHVWKRIDDLQVDGSYGEYQLFIEDLIDVADRIRNACDEDFIPHMRDELEALLDCGLYGDMCEDEYLKAFLTERFC